MARDQIPTLTSLRSLDELRRSPLAFFAQLRARYGDIMKIQLFFWPVVILNHPDYVKRVVQENYRNYNKNVPIFNLFRPLLGNGLVTNYGGESWLQQRRLMQPAFHRQRNAALATCITTATTQMMQQWEFAETKGQLLDVAEEMMHLTLQIVGKALFSIDMNDQADLFGRAFAQVNTFLLTYFNRPFPPLSIPTPHNLRFRRALRTLDHVVYDILKLRRRLPGEYADLLALLIDARDEETGQGMNDRQLRDEIMTLLIAGHETVANALTWCWYLLSQHPEVEQQLYAELDQVLGGRVPTMDDLPQLCYTRMVFEETMRLYPPVWIVMRKALGDDEIGGQRIPANTYVLWSTYALHRHPDFWEHPDQFNPQRFAPEAIATRPRYAYIPFSHGPRVCIGNAFAMTEAQLILATIAQRYRLTLEPGHRVDPLPLMTLGMRNGLRMCLQPR